MPTTEIHDLLLRNGFSFERFFYTRNEVRIENHFSSASVILIDNGINVSCSNIELTPNILEDTLLDMTILSNEFKPGMDRMIESLDMMENDPFILVVLRNTRTHEYWRFHRHLGRQCVQADLVREIEDMDVRFNLELNFVGTEVSSLKLEATKVYGYQKFTKVVSTIRLNNETKALNGLKKVQESVDRRMKELIQSTNFNLEK